MKKELLIIGIVIIIASLLLFTACKPEAEEGPETLFNESLNEEIEELTEPGPETEPGFEEFFFEWAPRNESKYEIAEDDIFTLTKGDFESTEISFFGLMLGDSYEDVLARLGIPDVMFQPADESYRNMDYKRKIGIGGQVSGLTFHLENDVVTRITVKPPFKKYLHGNTSIGTDKEIIYILLDVPDYQDFLSTFRIFFYVEKGVEVYFSNRYVDRLSFVMPEEFKGVEYVSGLTQLHELGIYTNVTKPVRIE